MTTDRFGWLRVLAYLCLLFLGMLSVSAQAQTHTFCPTDGNCTYTGTSSYAGNQTGPFIDKGGAVFNILAYGGNGNGSADNTAALNAANTAASIAGGIIFFPPGQYVFISRPNTFGVGVTLVGSGYGSTTTYGTFLIANYNEATATNGFLTWDGSVAFAGTGGGIERMSIFKGASKTGGAAVALVSTDDNHRPGFFHMSHVQINAGGVSSHWDYSFYVDGHNNTTSNSQGIRDIRLDDCWLSGANTTDATVWLNNVAKFTMAGGEIYPGFGSANGITITGTGGAGTSTSNSVAVSILGTHVAGNIVVDQASTVQIYADVVGDVTFTSNAAESFFIGSSTGTLTNSSTTSSTLRHTPTNNGWLVSKLISGTVQLGSAGDLAAARTATTGFYWGGSDGLGWSGRTSSGIWGFGGGSIQTIQIVNASAAVEFNTDNFISRTGSGALSFGSTNGGTDGALTLGSVKPATYLTATNCASSGGTCVAASAGRVSIAAAASTVVVATTAVTANSEIRVTRDNSLGTALSVTCNTQSSLVLGTPYVSARSAGTSFTVTIDVAPTTNPLCMSYSIIN